MKKLFGIVTAVFVLLFVTSSFSFPPPTSAADIRANDTVTISEDAENLKDLYLFGGNIQVDAPVTNDLVASGGDININNDVTGSVLAAGGNIKLRGDVGNTVRIAGGNIVIDGPITNDLVIAGGSITVTKNARIGGDLLFGGGKLRLDGPVQGKVLLGGGEITLNAPIGKDVNGHVGALTVGPDAVINGNLTYASPEKAQVESGAVVKGKTDFQRTEEENKNDAAEAFAWSSFYKLLADIIICILFIYFFRRALSPVLIRMKETPLKNAGIGFGFFFLVPLASMVLLILIWLGIASFLFYALLLLIGIFVGKLFLGWIAMRWWERQQKTEYRLDWKAGVAGPLILFLLLLIPILGWLIAAIIFFIALGALVREMMPILSGQRENHKTVKKK